MNYGRSQRREAPKMQQVAYTGGHQIDPFGIGILIKHHDMHTIGEIIRYMDKKTTIALGLPSNQKHLKDEGKK